MNYCQECIDYAYNLVLNRTYEGYKTEIETIYGQLEGAVERKIEPAPDNWDDVPYLNTIYLNGNILKTENFDTIKRRVEEKL